MNILDSIRKTFCCQGPGEMIDTPKPIIDPQTPNQKKTARVSQQNLPSLDTSQIESPGAQTKGNIFCGIRFTDVDLAKETYRAGDGESLSEEMLSKLLHHYQETLKTAKQALEFKGFSDEDEPISEKEGFIAKWSDDIKAIQALLDAKVAEAASNPVPSSEHLKAEIELFEKNELDSISDEKLAELADYYAKVIKWHQEVGQSNGIPVPLQCPMGNKQLIEAYDRSGFIADLLKQREQLNLL